MSKKIKEKFQDEIKHPKRESGGEREGAKKKQLTVEGFEPSPFRKGA